MFSSIIGFVTQNVVTSVLVAFAVVGGGGGFKSFSDNETKKTNTAQVQGVKEENKNSNKEKEEKAKKDKEIKDKKDKENNPGTI